MEPFAPDPDPLEPVEEVRIRHYAGCEWACGWHGPYRIKCYCEWPKPDKTDKACRTCKGYLT